MEQKVQSYLQAFQKLSLESKRKKLINVLKLLPSEIYFVPGVLKFLESNEVIEESFFVDIYRLIIKAAITKAQNSNQQILQQTTAVLKNIHETEASETVSDQELQNMLNHI